MGSTGHTNYRIFRFNGSNDVYMHEDRNSGTKVVGKFFFHCGNEL